MPHLWIPLRSHFCIDECTKRLFGASVLQEDGRMTEAGLPTPYDRRAELWWGIARHPVSGNMPF